MRVRLTIGEIKDIIRFFKFENGTPVLAVRKFERLKIRKAQKLFSEKDKWDEYLMRTDIKSKVLKGYIKYAVEDQEHLMRP